MNESKEKYRKNDDNCTNNNSGDSEAFERSFLFDTDDTRCNAGYGERCYDDIPDMIPNGRKAASASEVTSVNGPKVTSR